MLPPLHRKQLVLYYPETEKLLLAEQFSDTFRQIPFLNQDKWTAGTMSFRLTDNRNSLPCKTRAKSWHFALGLIVLAWCSQASADAPADMDTYCTGKFGSRTLSGIDRRNNSPLCSERTSNGLGLLHHRVDPAAVCNAQHQTSRYRKEGPKVICLTGADQPTGKQKIDLADYCRNTYGQSAILSQRLTDNKPLCTVKGDGGLSQVHHVVDVGELCGGTSGLVDDQNVLNCGPGTSGSAGGANPGGKPGSGHDAAGNGRAGGGEPASNSPNRNNVVPETAALSASDDPDLEGCGIPVSPELSALGWGKDYASLLSPSFKAETDLAPGSKRRLDLEIEFSKASMWMSGGELTPCPSLSGGMVVDIADICRLNPINPSLGWVGSSPESTARHYPRPVCHAPDTEPNPTFIGTPLIDGCYEMYPDQASLRRAGKDESGNDIIEGRLYPIMKWTGASQIECFYLEMPTPDISELMD